MSVDTGKLNWNTGLMNSLMRLTKEKGEVKTKEAYNILADEYELSDNERIFLSNTRPEPKWKINFRRAKQQLQKQRVVKCKGGKHGLWILIEAGGNEVLKLIGK